MRARIRCGGPGFRSRRLFVRGPLSSPRALRPGAAARALRCRHRTTRRKVRGVDATWTWAATARGPRRRRPLEGLVRGARPPPCIQELLQAMPRTGCDGPGGPRQQTVRASPRRCPSVAVTVRRAQYRCGNGVSRRRPNRAACPGSVAQWRPMGGRTGLPLAKNPGVRVLRAVPRPSRRHPSAPGMSVLACAGAVLRAVPRPAARRRRQVPLASGPHRGPR